MEYIKPEVEFVMFDSENVTTSVGGGATDVVSSNVNNPWG